MTERIVYAESAVKSLAVIKEDIQDNQFDVRLLEVVDVDGEVLDVSVHQDWEVVATSSVRTLAGRNIMDVDCINISDYKSNINNYLGEVNEILPSLLLTKFESIEAFCCCEDFDIDRTSIGFVNKCGNCSGTGKVNCSSCGGSGRRYEKVHVSDNISYSTDSHGNRREISRTPVYETRSYTCGSCGGSGRVICSPCGGTGLITNITDITRSAKLTQTYSIEQGKYSDKSVAEIMRIPTELLKNMAIWDIGQSMAQGNHFQIQYIAVFQIIFFYTQIEQSKFSFMSLYDGDIDKPHIFEKSPILETILHKPINLATTIINSKKNSNAGYQLLAEFENYKFLSEIMTELLSTTDYSVKNVRLLVDKSSKQYISNDKQVIITKAIAHAFKTCAPTYSKKALIFSSLWLLFTYEVIALPFLPLGRSISIIDWFIVSGIMVLISGFVGAFFSKKIVDKKHSKLPENITAPKTKHFKMAFRVAGIFAFIGWLSVNIHDAVFDKFFGGGVEQKFYHKHTNDNKKESSRPVVKSESNVAQNNKNINKE